MRNVKQNKKLKIDRGLSILCKSLKSGLFILLYVNKSDCFMFFGTPCCQRIDKYKWYAENTSWEWRIIITMGLDGRRVGGHLVNTKQIYCEYKC